MKIILCLLIVAAFIFTESSADCPSGVALTCLNPTNDVTIDRGASGPPGKRGAKGSPGPKGDKGGPGPQGECSKQCINTLTAAQQRITELETNLSRLERYNFADKRNCDDFKQNGIAENGVYTISISGKPVAVYCDFETDGGNWLVFQRRESGLVDFFRDWRDYEVGFGLTNGEFWLGLENLHYLTSSSSYKLRIDLEDFEGNAHYAEYSTFAVEGSNDNYRLRVGEYSGDAGSALSVHADLQFTTKDRDNDEHSSNCAVTFTGAWWYRGCHASNLNGMYLARGEDASNCKGIRWSGFPGTSGCNSLKKSEMKISLN